MDKEFIRSVGGAGLGPEIKMKHRIVHALQKYFLNPPIKVLLALGVASPGDALLETIGRKGGKPVVLRWAMAALAASSGLWLSTAETPDASATSRTIHE